MGLRDPGVGEPHIALRGTPDPGGSEAQRDLRAGVRPGDDTQHGPDLVNSSPLLADHLDDATGLHS